MDGMECAVVGCNNSKVSGEQDQNREILFYEFPKNRALNFLWIKSCGRPPSWSTENRYVCSEHFTEADYEPESFESDASIPKNVMLGSIPSINLHQSGTSSITDKRFETSIEDSLKLAIVENLTLIDTENKNVVPAELYEVLEKQYQYTEINKNLKEHLRSHEELIDKIDKRISELQKRMNKLLKSQFEAEYKETTRFEQAITYFLTRTQKSLAADPETDGVWNIEILLQSLAIRYLSKRCYIFLQKNLGYSLPQLHSFQRWALKLNFREDIFQDFFHVMEIVGKELSDNERLTVLQLGEMRVKPVYEYEPATDKVIGPYTYAQTIVATGLLGEWKQPVYIAFDVKITKAILVELIEKLHDISFRVIACVLECNEDLPNLWNEFEISSGDNYFSHPVTDNHVYYFVDPTSLLRNIRNELINNGFELKFGRKVNAEPLKYLINSIASGRKHSSKINQKHLEVAQEHYRSKLAAELFCQDVAMELKQGFPDFDNALSHCTGYFIEYIGKWYTYATKSFGANMFRQNPELKVMEDMVRHIIAEENPWVSLLKEALLASTDSLRFLVLRLWERQIGDLPSAKLSNDEVKNFISHICRDEDSLSPLNVFSRLRTILMDEYERRWLYYGDDYLIRNLFLSLELPRIKNKDDNVDLSDQPLRNLPLVTFTEAEDFSYLVASIAEKFLAIYPEMGTRIGNPSIDPPKNDLMTTESFVDPSDTWLIQANQLNNVFIKFHKKDILSGTPNITKRMVNMAKNSYPEINEDVAKDFLEKRLLLRIKYLNKKLEMIGYQGNSAECIPNVIGEENGKEEIRDVVDE